MAVDVRTLIRPGVSSRQREATLAPPVASFAIVVALADVLALALAVVFVGHGSPSAYVVVGAAVAVLAMRGHYRIGITPSVSREVGGLLGSLAVAGVGAAVLAGPQAALVLRVVLAGSAGVLMARIVVYRVARMLRARSLIVEPTLIVGAGQVGVEVANVLQDHPEYGLLPVGFLDSFPDSGLPLPILGGMQSMDSVLREYEVRRVIIAFGATREPDLVPVLRACDRRPVDIHVLPRFFELGMAPGSRNVDHIWGLPLVCLRRSALRSSAWRIKRLFDVTVATTALVVTAPIFGLIALAVKLSSPGPIFFRQPRVGQRGRVVDVLKFRSMRVNHDSDVQWSVQGDGRLTAVGRVIRKLSLDELPQLINVLRGEMSLVGPRPERPFFVGRFADEVVRYGDRHRVPVGLTGWAQVHGLRGDTSIEQRARFDNQYIENWSLWQDVVILFRTTAAVVRDALARDHGAARAHAAEGHPSQGTVASGQAGSPAATDLRAG